MKKILIADDEKNMRWVLSKNLREESFQVIEAGDGEEAFEMFLDEEPDMLILDYKMPKTDGMEVLRRINSINSKVPVIMITAHGTTGAAVEAMKLGALDYISKPFDIEELKLKINKALNLENLQSELDFLRAEINTAFDTKIVGSSKRMHEIYELIKKVADTNATVMIMGESGTGKELIANAIHSKSFRRDKPYIKINCSALPETLLESELFGYEKGAFTGAQGRKLGRFDRAQGGTLFLDEIGELSQALQVKLLRVLQEREFERVGGTEVIKADVRIITATNRDLDKMVCEGKFREDLLYRLKVIPIDLPPLRNRKEDIPSLAAFFIEKYTKEMNKGRIEMSDEVLDILNRYDFPGNIRELENIVERMVIFSTGSSLGPELIPKEVVKNAFSGKEFEFLLPQEGINLEDVEKSFVIQALERANGNQTHAAKLLGISRHALIYRLDKFGLKY